MGSRFRQVHWGASGETTPQPRPRLFSIRQAGHLLKDGHLKRPRAKFDIIEKREDAIFIADTGTDTISVTNDAEAVVAYLNELFPARRIFYLDTIGYWDELIHEAGTFKGFAPGTGPAGERHAPA